MKAYLLPFLMIAGTAACCTAFAAEPGSAGPLLKLAIYSNAEELVRMSVQAKERQDRRRSAKHDSGAQEIGEDGDALDPLVWAFLPLNGAGLVASKKTTLGTICLAVQGTGLVTGLALIAKSRYDGNPMIDEDDFIEAMTGLGLIAGTFIPTYLIDVIGTYLARPVPPATRRRLREEEDFEDE